MAGTPPKSTFTFGVAVIVAGLMAFFACVGGVAQADAAAIGKGGVVYACYKTQMPNKGAVRVVGKKQRCKPGERKTSWSVTGPAGPAGRPGTNGTSGTNGTNGTGGTTTDTTTTKNLTDALNFQQLQITELLDQIEGLQSILGGLTNGELLGAITNAAKLDGISGATLNQLVGSLPVLSSLCSQLSVVTGQTNALRTVLGGLGLNGVLTVLGGLLQVPALPTALNPFSCPS